MFYVGAQIMCWTYIYQYAETLGIDNRSAVTYAYWALILFLIGRWIGTYLLKFVSSGKLLMYFAIGAMAFTHWGYIYRRYDRIVFLSGHFIMHVFNVSYYLWHCFGRCWGRRQIWCRIFGYGHSRWCNYASPTRFDIGLLEDPAMRISKFLECLKSIFHSCFH